MKRIIPILLLIPFSIGMAKEAKLPAKPEKVELALSVKEKKVEITGREKAVVKTNKGTFIIKLFPDDAPRTVENFVRLAEAGFYDGLYFHRYVPDFVIQGGDPLGNGTGNCGWTVPAEFENQKHTHIEGAVGLARGDDPNSGSCQFYITLSPQHGLDGNYTVFGKVIKGMDVVHSLRRGDKIIKITIIRKEEEK